ncbi:MAG TPA: ABC transporter permease [Gemmatimonadaceae bacterium]
MPKRFFRLPWRTSRQIRVDIDDELAFHIDERVDALIALGLVPDVARAQAARELGDVDDARRYIGAVDRDIEAAQRRSDFMSDLLQDISYAARKLRSTPAFTLAAVATLALGIGATTAIFSVVNTVLLQPLPFPQSDRLMRIKFTQQGHGDAGTPMDIIDYRTQSKSFVGIAAGESTTGNLSRQQGDAERLSAVRVSANWFDLLRVKPVVGRFFNPEDDHEGTPLTAILSEAVWRRDFSADPNIAGKIVNINAVPRTVIGVAPAGRYYPTTVDIWMPKQFTAQELSDESRGARWMFYLARVKDSVDPKVANAEVRNISIAMEKRFPEQLRERRAEVVALHDYIVGDMRKPLLVIFAAVVFVLLIAAANVANLLLVRAQAREGEMAIRTALGAGRGRLVRQLMTESVLLSLCGGAIGVAIAKLGMTKLLSSAPPSLVLVQRSSIDGFTLTIVALVAVLTGLIFGVLPALQAGKLELSSTLRAGGRGANGRPTANRTKRAIVVAELALAVVLLSGAGLLLRSFAQLLSVNPGFRPENVLTMKVVLPLAHYDSTRARAYVRDIETRARALPGVQDVAVASYVPLDNGSYNFTFDIRGRTFARPSDEPSAEVRQVSNDFFRTLGIPLVRGRNFGVSDVPGSPPVFVVNEAFAKRFFPNEDVLNQQIRLGWGQDNSKETRQIVGVVGDVHSFGLDQQPEPTVYVSQLQYPATQLTIAVRGKNAAAFTAPMRVLLRDLDRDVAVFSVMTMDERVASSIGAQRFYASLIGIFAVVALVLAAVGLYGVIAYAVSQRTHELGVRVALGATTSGISRMVIGEGLTLTAIGVVIGTISALLMGRIVSSLLFGVSARDPLTLLGVAVTLGAIATLASWLPARRAARVDPLIAIRGD